MIDDRLDSDIEAGAKARPRFSTEIITTDGGWEFRNSRWAYPLHEFEFNVEPGYVGTVEYNQFADLFYAAGGSAESFLFRHWADHDGLAEPIGTGDGAETDFQLMKTYTRGLISRTRKITRPVTGTVEIYVNTVLQVSGYSVDYSTGMISFDLAPSASAAITADFEFDIPVRFLNDEAEFFGHTGELQQPMQIVITEIKE